MSNSKRILAALLAGAMVLCAGCGKEEETEEESSNSTAVEVTDVTSGAMSSEYTLNGKIAAVNEVQVFPLLAGQVQTLNVSEGDTVSKGQTLFTVLPDSAAHLDGARCPAAERAHDGRLYCRCDAYRVRCAVFNARQREKQMSRLGYARCCRLS